MRTAITISSTTATTYLTDVYKSRDRDAYRADIFLYGTFGGGTCTIQAGPGTTATLINIKDISGNTVDSTANEMFNIELAAVESTHGGQIKLYATHSSTTAPSFTVALYDNR